MIRIIKDFIFDRAWQIVCMILFWVLLFIFFFAYDFPMQDFSYLSLLYVLCMAAAGLGDFFFYSKTRKHLIQDLFDGNLAYLKLPPTRQNQYIEDLYQKMRQIQEETIDTLILNHKESEDYFALWAHQAKLPLAAMQLIADLDPIDRNELKGQLNRMDGYVDMIMAYSRIHSDSSDYIIEKLDVDMIIRKAIRSFSTQFISKKISLDYKPIDEWVITDAKWFLFVVEQVLSNAVKYTTDKIWIYEEGKSLVIEDNGPGISQSDIHRIYEKGYTGVIGRVSEEASGLGLYLCSKTLNSLNHEYHIESTLNKGTKFYIGLERK